MTIRFYNKLPLLEQLVQRYCPKSPLKGRRLLLVQHQLSDAPAQIEALIALGVSPESIHWIDIPYTSFESTRSMVLSLGIPENNLLVTKEVPVIGYENWQIDRLRRWFRRHSHDASSLTILDDGGLASRALADLLYREKIIWQTDEVSFVEQTQRGVLTLRNNADSSKLLKHFPIINIAESKAKKQLESPAIAQAVVESLADNLRGRANFKTALIIGYGSIGEPIADKLHKYFALPKCNIWVDDIQPTRIQRALTKGYNRWRAEPNNRVDLLIGCTGTASFAPDRIDWLSENAIVISAASGAIEVSRDKFLSLSNNSERTFIDIRKMHDDLNILYHGKHFRMLNGGFPINFDGTRTDRISFHDIQVTATLMVWGAIQASINRKRKGLIDLDSNFERWIFELTNGALN